MHRLATLADLDAVHSIYMHSDVTPISGSPPTPRPDFVKVLRDLVASQSFYIVEHSGRVQGFYRTSRYEGRERHVAYLGTFAVDPEALGTGLERSIIGTAISRRDSEGVTRIELMLEADNPRALSFYRKLGPFNSRAPCGLHTSARVTRTTWMSSSWQCCCRLLRIVARPNHAMERMTDRCTLHSSKMTSTLPRRTDVCPRPPSLIFGLVRSCDALPYRDRLRGASGLQRLSIVFVISEKTSGGSFTPETRPRSI